VGEPEKRAQRRGATIAFADEAGFNLLPSVVRTWARVGQTPVLKTPTRYEHLSVASAITTSGRLVTQVRGSTFNGEAIVGFLKHLLQEIPGKLVLVWDGARIHHCAIERRSRVEEVKAFLKGGAAQRLRLIRLPAYAPELNPDEGVWRWLKRQLGNLCCRDFKQLRYELGLAIQRLRRRPQIIQACFEKAGLQL
jgi:transposase